MGEIAYRVIWQRIVRQTTPPTTADRILTATAGTMHLAERRQRQLRNVTTARIPDVVNARHLHLVSLAPFWWSPRQIGLGQMQLPLDGADCWIGMDRK